MIDEDITYDMRKAYMENLLDDIRIFSDLDWQKKVWIEGSIPGIVGSWEESMCMFFDDRNIDYFLANIDPKYGLSQKQIDKLWEVRNFLDNYCESTPRYMDPTDVLKDPRWHEIAQCAQTVLKEFEGYEVPLDPQQVPQES